MFSNSRKKPIFKTPPVSLVAKLRQTNNTSVEFGQFAIWMQSDQVQVLWQNFYMKWCWSVSFQQLTVLIKRTCSSLWYRLMETPHYTCLHLLGDRHCYSLWWFYIIQILKKIFIFNWMKKKKTFACIWWCVYIELCTFF